MKYFYVCCLCVTLLKLVWAELIVKSAVPLETFNELFLRDHGWLGADGLYSCKISENVSIWHFADTFIGDRVENERTNWTLIRNSVGIEKGKLYYAKCNSVRIVFGAFWHAEKEILMCPAHHRKNILIFRSVLRNSYSFDFYWTKSGLTDSFYLPPDGKGWFWPKAMVYHQNRLHIFLTQHEYWGPDIGWDYGPIGAWTAIVDNPTEIPTNWKISYSRTPFLESTLERNITFDASILRQDDYFYIYGFSESTIEGTDIRDFITSRVKVNQLRNYDSYEFYKNASWVDNFKDASLLFHAAGEFSVHYDNGLQRYLAVYSDSWPSSDILARTATTPSGPWSEPVKLYSVPDMSGKPNSFCYSGKAHPQMSGRNHLVVSYVCNSFVMNDVIVDATMYMPKFVQINYQNS